MGDRQRRSRSRSRPRSERRPRSRSPEHRRPSDHYQRPLARRDEDHRRSKSPSPAVRRYRDRDAHASHDHGRRYDKTREKASAHGFQRSPSLPRSSRPKSPSAAPKTEFTQIPMIDPDDTDAMAAVMGFGNFDSTKGKSVADNVSGASSIKRRQKGRQFMHVKGLYNRPLTKQQLTEGSKDSTMSNK